jgi:hypothetical protein
MTKTKNGTSGAPKRGRAAEFCRSGPWESRSPAASGPGVGQPGLGGDLIDVFQFGPCLNALAEIAGRVDGEPAQDGGAFLLVFKMMFRIILILSNNRPSSHSVA